ncbi:MAG TPA: hypothetical protein QGI72_04705 [Poseidonia sp.]|nr:hypothetical protein [Poseidonia sp.]
MRWSALLLNLGLFSILFLAHIGAAAMDFDILFRLIATSITLQILFFGPVSILIGSQKPRFLRRELNRFSFIIALPLSIGLGWAYGGMEWSIFHVISVVFPTIIVHMTMDSLLRR